MGDGWRKMIEESSKSSKYLFIEKIFIEKKILKKNI